MQNSRFRVRKLFRFEAAHQLLDGSCSDAACSSIHGHSFKVEVVLSAQRLDRNGMVIDPDVLGKMRSVTDKYDHALILPACIPDHLQGQLEEHHAKLVLVDFNPTAENLALEMYTDFGTILSTHLEAGEGNRLHVDLVRVHETDSDYAEYEEPDERPELVDGGDNETYLKEESPPEEDIDENASDEGEANG